MPWKDKTDRLFISRLGREIISKAFVRVWVGPAFLLCANFDTKFGLYAFYDHLRIKNAFAVKGLDSSPLYQSTRKRDNFKGFRTFSYRFLVSSCLPSLRNFWHKRVVRIPSTIIFESNQEHFCCDRARQFAFVSVNWEERSFQTDSYVFGFALPSILTQIWTQMFGHMLSTIIFESRTFLPWWGKTGRLCISRLGSE